MQISLTGRFEEIINHKLATGMYDNADEVVKDSLRFMQTHEEWIYQIKLEKLKSELQIGIKQLDEGDSVDGREFFARLKQDESL